MLVDRSKVRFHNRKCPMSQVLPDTADLACRLQNFQPSDALPCFQASQVVAQTAYWVAESLENIKYAERGFAHM